MPEINGNIFQNNFFYILNIYLYTIFKKDLTIFLQKLCKQLKYILQTFKKKKNHI